MKIILTSILTVIIAISAFGEMPADSVKVYFLAGRRLFDPSFGNNGRAMESFIEKVKEAKAQDNIDYLTVRGYASPEGASDANQRLSGLRCDEIAKYIAKHAGVDSKQIRTYADGVAWAELRNLVAHNPDVPSQERVLHILDNTPLWIYNAQGTKIIDGRKKQLMDLAGGRPWNWMMTNLFPELRNAVAVVLYLKNQDKPKLPDGKAENPTTPQTETIIPDEILTAETNTAEEIIPPFRPSPTDLNDIEDLKDNNDSKDIKVTTKNNYGPKHFFMAIKTNLLYDAALLPNLELEWMIKDGWSVAIEGDLAWWKDDPKHKYYDLAMICMEGRRWFAEKRPWHGIYVGIFGGGGKYDLENKRRGYYGEGIMAGVSAGYMFPIGKCFSLEAGIGVGYMRTQYKEYYPNDGHYVYERTKSLNYFGPLKLKFAIAWHFLDTNKSKRTTSP